MQSSPQRPTRPPSAQRQNNARPQPNKKPAATRTAPPAEYRGHSKTRKKKRRSQLTGMVILFIIVALLALLAYWFASPKPAEAEAPTSTSKAQSTVSQPLSETTTPAASVSRIPATEGTLDVEGIPPLYNRNHPIPAEVQASLQLANTGDQQMETQAAEAFLAMQAAAAADGIDLMPVSGYRTPQRQENNYNTSIQNYMRQGHSQEEATRLTEQYYAIPGTSEHEVGLAMDIGQVDDSFADTAAYTWLQEHCTEYGFIYRYKQGYESTTFINWEPWHYRFIGVNHAQLYTQQNMSTLEDYIAWLEEGESQPS